MRSAVHIVLRSLVFPFYRENAGLFVFFFTVMFCVVNKVDGAAVLEYHYSLILAMLNSYVFLAMVFAGWLLYARKYTAFVTASIKRTDFVFLHLFNSLRLRNRLLLFGFAAFCLLFPVLLYAGCIVTIACKRHNYIDAGLVLFFILLLCSVPAWLHVHVLSYPEGKGKKTTRKMGLRPRSYAFILLYAVWNEQKILWVILTIFTCAIVFLIAGNNTIGNYDYSFPFLFFNFGMMANGILIFRLAGFEEQQLSFYRSLPVSLGERFVSYALLYFILVIPECILLLWLTPIHLHVADAFSFIGCAYGLLLLMNSMRFAPGLSMKNFLKQLFLVFCLQFAVILTAGLAWLACASLFVAAFLFWKSYDAFETTAPS